MKSVLGSLFVGTLLVSSASYAQLSFAKNLTCDWVDPIQSVYLSNHLIFKQKDKELQARVTDQFIKHIDPAKIYFLQADVDLMRSNMKNLFDDIAKKKCGFIADTQTLLLKRMNERTEHIKKFLGKDFKFLKDTEFVYDPDKKEYAKTEAEANDFLDKYLQFQIANYLATDMKLDEAKKRVIKNHERNLKRATDTNNDELVARYLNDFALALDPHSSFFSKDSFDDFSIDMKLKLEGIGATLSYEDGFTVVESLVTGGAAAKSGLIEPKDKIVAVSKGAKMENVIDMDLKDVVKLIRGPKGTKVKLTILRKESGSNKKFDLELTRERISLDEQGISINYDERTVDGVKKKVGIINFPSFYADSNEGGRTSSADLRKVIADAKVQKADALVVDLTSNGGGSLDDAVKIGGMFIKTGNIVKQSSLKKSESALADDDKAVDWNGPLVILTSRVSASASEILSGAMKDYGRAVIVGADHTYGKGSIQQVLPIPGDLGALKITVGMFFTPGGYSTQHRGVEADILLPSPYALDDIGEKSMDYSLPPKKIESFLSKEANSDDSKERWQPIQAGWIKSLKSRSELRVAKNDEFKKINEELEKTKKMGKKISVADVLKDKGEKEKKVKKSKFSDKKTRDAEYLKRADIQEAVNVATDLLILESGKNKDLNMVQIQPVAEAKPKAAKDESKN